MSVYECCSVRRFLRLVMLDIIIFVIAAALFFIGSLIFPVSFHSSGNDEKGVFLPVIMYHSICEKSAGNYSVTPSQVESDLSYLKSNGYTSVTVQQIADYVFSGGKLPEKPVLITLDDGFYNNLYYLVPLLEKYDMTAVVSIVGSFTNKNAALDPHVPEYSYLTWDDVNALLDSGRIEIGNHTYDMHSNNSQRKGCGIISGESEETYREIFGRDILLLQSEIRAQTGITPFVFAYPYGIASPESKAVLRENGFLITLTCREIPNYINRSPYCLYGIGRYNRSGFYSTEEFMQKLLTEN